MQSDQENTQFFGFDSKEFNTFQRSFVLPFLKNNLNIDQRIEVFKGKDPWEINFRFKTQKRSHIDQEVKQLGFTKVESEELHSSVVQMSWMIEALFDLNSQDIQEKLKEKNPEFLDEHLWGLVDADALGTPMGYVEEILKFAGLKDGQKLIDIGSGYGNIGLYMGLKCPKNTFLGYEIIPERVAESNRIKDNFKFSNIDFKNQDVSDSNFTLPEADIFYLYDPVNPRTFDKVIQDLKAVYKQRKKPFKLVAIKGKSNFLYKLSNQDWLEKREVLELSNPYRLVFIYETK